MNNLINWATQYPFPLSFAHLHLDKFHFILHFSLSGRGPYKCQSWLDVSLTWCIVCNSGFPGLTNHLNLADGTTQWWRLSRPLAKIRAILPPLKTGLQAMPRSQSHYKKHDLNWFCSANTISRCPKNINIQSLHLKKKMGSGGKSC